MTCAVSTTLLLSPSSLTLLHSHYFNAHFSSLLPPSGNALTDQLHHLNEQYKAPTDASANSLFEGGGDLFPSESEGGHPVDAPPVPPATEDSHENTVRIGAGSSFDELTSSLFAANTAATNHHTYEGDAKLPHPKTDSGARRDTNPFDNGDSLPSHIT